MNIWMWLIIGFLTGLVVAAIFNLIFKGGVAEESEPAQGNASASLAKAEVKIAVLEDKVRQAEADQIALRASLEAEYEDKLTAVEADYRVQLAILESEKREKTLEESKAELERDAALLDKDIVLESIETETISLDELPGEDDHLEELIIVDESAEIAEDVLNSEVDSDDDFTANAVIAGALVATAVVAEEKEEGDLEEQDDQLEIDEQSDIELVPEVIVAESGNDVVEQRDEIHEIAAPELVAADSVEEEAEKVDDAIDTGVYDHGVGSLAAVAIGAGVLSENDSDEETPSPEDELVENPATAVNNEMPDEELVAADVPIEDEPEVEEDEDKLLSSAGTAAAGVAASVAIISDDENDHDLAEEPEDNVVEGGAEASEEEKAVEPAVPEWPEDNSVWQGEYFNNKELEGDPVLVREDDEVNFDWGFGSPSPEINIDNFSVRWTRKADFPPGLYRFTVTSDDGVRLWVNERLVISAWYDHNQMTFRREMELPGGAVNLRLEYYEKDMAALIECSWERIG